LGDVVYRRFGGEIDFEDGSDPLVRKLRLLAASPDPVMRWCEERIRVFQWSRSRVVWLLSLNDQLDREMGHAPGTSPWLHRRWLREMVSYDQDSNVFDETDGYLAAQRVTSELEAPVPMRATDLANPHSVKE